MSDATDNAAPGVPLGYATPPLPPPPGAAVPAMPLVPGVVDASGRVAGDVPCRKCSYNLRGQDVSARCPECGAPVGVALHGPLLRYSDPEWVRNLARGTAFVFWGMILNLVVTVVSVAVAFAAGPLVAKVFDVAAGLVYLYGAWLLTEPDPSGTGEDQYGTVRKVIRITLVVGLAHNVIVFLMQRTAAAPPVAVTLGVVMVGVGLVGVVGQFATLRYLERLAERIPEPRLAARAHLLFWGYGCTRAAMVVMGGLSTLLGLITSRAAAATMPGGGTIGLFMGLGCLSFAAFVGVVVFGIMFLILLYRLQMEFDRQSQYARAVWAGVEAGPPRAG